MLIALCISILIIIVVATIPVVIVVPVVCYPTVIVLQSLYINIFILSIFMPILVLFFTGAVLTTAGVISGVIWIIACSILYRLFLFNSIWFWRLSNHWWNHNIPIYVDLQKNPVVQLWLLFFLIVLKYNLLWVFFYILLWLYPLVLLLYHLWLHLYWIVSNLLLYLLKLCLYLSCWVTRSHLPHRETSSSALAGSLTCPGHLLRENELSIEEIKIMQFSTKNKKQI
jgi:hypothetical protein